MAQPEGFTSTLRPVHEFGNMRFFTLVYKNVVRRRLRTLLTIGGLSTAVAAVVALVGISNGFVRSFHDVYQAHGVDLIVSRKGAADRLSSAMDERLAERIHRIDGIEDASGFLLETMSLEEEAIYGLPTIGIRSNSRMLRDYTIHVGSNLQPGDEKVVLLGCQLASRLERKIGETIVFYEDEKFEVAGIFQSTSVWENGSLIVPLRQLQRLTDRDEQVTFVNVVLAGPPNQQKVEQAIQRIQTLDPKLSALPTEDFVETDTRIRIAGTMAWMTSSVALLVGAIGMFNTMMTSVFERTREIGILRAIGWKPFRVVRMILLEAGLLSGTAAVAGILGGIAIARSMSRLPSTAGIISPSIDAAVMAQGFAIAVVIGLLGAAYPAYRSARLVPTESMRYE